ncbi:hypothetical protein HYV80_02575 [Candidatus Woesearchaeota archaeon]|nr:hypothetical protein [Candidatus Woesearchaeota archaeon]
MAKIHGFVYILVGAFISIMSWKLNREKLIFFYYAGFVFVFIGVVKLIFSWIKTKANEPKTHVQHKTLKNHPIAPQQVKYCNKCRNVVKITDKFCNRCGARV